MLNEKLALIDTDIISTDNKFASDPLKYLTTFYSLYTWLLQNQSFVRIINKHNGKCLVNATTNVVLNQIIDILSDGRKRDFRGFLVLDNVRPDCDFNSELKEIKQTSRLPYDKMNGVLFNIDNKRLNKIKIVPSVYNEFGALLKTLGTKDFAILLYILYYKTEIFYLRNI